MARDPLVATTREPYGYAGDDPINRADPSGLGEREGELPCWPFCELPPPVVRGAGELVKGVGEGAEKTWHGVESVWNEVVGGGDEAQSEQNDACGGVPFTTDQDALVKIAKEAKRNGLSPEEAEALQEWAEEYNISFRGPESHPGRGFGKNPHYRLGPVNHIPTK